MPIDASIYQGLQPVQQPNPLATLAQAYQVRGLQARADAEDRAVQEQRGLADAYRGAMGADGALDRNKLLMSVAQGGYGAAIPSIQKGFADQDKSSRDAEKAKYEAMLKQFDVAAQIMSGVTDQASWDRARAMTAQAFGPEKAAQMPAEYNPQLIAENQQKALAVKDQVEQRYKALTFSETQRHNQAAEGTAAGNLAVSQGQLAVSQGNLATRQAEAEAGKIPAGYRRAADGVSLEFIPGGPADPNTKPAGGKPLNDTQAKALQFGTRMQTANEILDKLSESGVNASIPGARAGYGVGAVISALQPAERQQLDQAKRDFINAVLRRESGAAISPSEFDSAEKQYFPQPGDSAEVRTQKKQNRELSTRGILAEVPDADTRVAQVRGAGAKANAASGVINVANAADYAKVPSGATYQTPDGKIRRKP